MIRIVSNTTTIILPAVVSSLMSNHLYTDIDGSQTDTDDVKSLTSSPDDYQTDSLYSLPFTVQDCKSPDDDTTEVKHNHTPESSV